MSRQPVIWSMAAMLSDSTVVAAVVRTRPRAIQLATISMRKSTHGFPFVSHIGVAFGAPLLKFIVNLVKVTPYSFNSIYT